MPVLSEEDITFKIQDFANCEETKRTWMEARSPGMARWIVGEVKKQM